MICPKCDGFMVIVERQGIEVDFCPECKSIFFDSTELNMLSKALGVDFEVPDPSFFTSASTDEKARNCPRCNTLMDKVCVGKKPPVFDYCPKGHGVFFDEGELGTYVQNNTIRPENKIVQFLQETLSF